MFCGLLHHHQIVYVSGRCPFCMADKELPWEERMFEFDVPSTFSAHMEHHFKIVGEKSLPCPHPRCPEVKYPPAELKEHLEDVHSLKHTSRSRRGRPRQPLRPVFGTAPFEMATELATESVSTKNDTDQSTSSFRNDECRIIDAEEYNAATAIEQLPGYGPLSDSPSSTIPSTSLSTVASFNISVCTTPSSASTIPTSDSGAPSARTEISAASLTENIEAETGIPFNPLSGGFASPKRAGRRLPTRDTPPVTRQRAKADTERCKRMKYSQGVEAVAIEGVACHSEVKEVESQSFHRPTDGASDDQAESSPTDYTSLSTAIPPRFELVSAQVGLPKLCSPRRQPSRATPPVTRRRARLETESSGTHSA